MNAKLLFLMLSLGALGMAQTQSPRKLIASMEGKDLYVAYCASCHGMDGKGKGPVAAALKAPVPDLTQIAKRKGGKFVVAELEKFILGEGEVKAAHGSVDMPVWGPVFQRVEKDQDLGLVRVRRVVEYLKSMQVR
jgi:hypothetical protein